jgi:hypothetical protein
MVFVVKEIDTVKVRDYLYLWPSDAVAESKGGERRSMAERKPFIGPIKADPELKRLLDESRRIPVTEEELHEQRISFAFGNAPVSAKNITKDSVRKTSQNIKLLA